MKISDQLEYEASGSGESQCDKIFAYLLARRGEWVPMPDLYRASGAMAVHSRISDLRKRGCSIEHRNTKQGRAIHSFYRLTSVNTAP